MAGELLYVNNALVKIMEFEDAEAMIADGAVVRYKDPKDRDVLLENLKKSGSIVNYEIKIVTQKGNEKIALISSILENDILFGMVSDITQRKEAQQALYDSEEKFRAITHTATDAIIVMDNKGKITNWNPSAEKMFGYNSDEAIGKELHRFLVHKRYSETYGKGFRKFTRTGKGPVVGKTVELVALKKDGTEFPIEVSPSALQIKGKWCSVGIIRDITKRKEDEDTLRESELRYRSLVESFSDIVFITDYTSRMMYANPALKEQTGFTAGDFQFPQEENPLIHPDDADRVAKFIAEFVASNKQTSGVIENRFNDKWDQIHWYSSVITKVEYKHKLALMFISP